MPQNHSLGLSDLKLVGKKCKFEFELGSKPNEFLAYIYSLKGLPVPIPLAFAIPLARSRWGNKVGLFRIVSERIVSLHN